MVDSLDWRWLRSFVEVAEAGGTTAAEAKTNISQATLSRHIRQLEEQLSVSLFDRQGRALVLSPRGTVLLEHARAIRDSVVALERGAQGLQDERAGSVRVTMSVMFGQCLAPAWLRLLREAHPKISIDLVLDDREVNLLLREAEIAVRLFRPTQSDLFLKRCGTMRHSFFASEAYLAQHGRPSSLEELKTHALIGYDQATQWLVQAKKMGFDFSRDDFVVRSDQICAHPNLAAAGLGVVVLSEYAGSQFGLTRLFDDVTVYEQPVFLTAHPDLKTNPLVSQVWEHLGNYLKQQLNDQ